MEKKEITNEEVLNEFKEIKNSSNGGLIFLIIVLILLLGASIYYIYTLKQKTNEPIQSDYLKEEIKDKEDTTINNDEQEKTEENTLKEKKGHVLNSTVGKFIVDKNGIVYYENVEKFNFLGIESQLTEETLSVLGTKEKYINNTYQNSSDCVIETSGCTVEAYKLDLTNISSAYEVYQGNGAIDISIIFLSYDGIISELIFKEESEKIKITLNKNNSKYSNIVSIVPNTSISGNSVFLIDKYGNKYTYESE